MSTTTDPPTPLRLYLIRHGETEWSLSGQHTGRNDIPLTPRGEEEARELGQRLGGIRFSHTLTSPLQRTRKTCELAGMGAAANVEPDLEEWYYGAYEGQCSAEIHKTNPGWNVFRDGCPDGETPLQVSARADRLIARLRSLNGNIALFSHGQFGSALAVRWIGLDVVEAEHFQLGTASVSILGFHPHHPDVPVIALWNDLAHLLTDPSPVPRPKQTAVQRWENEGGGIS